MKKQKIILTLAALSITAAIGYNANYVLAVPATPPQGGGQGGSNNAAPTFSGATTLSADTDLSDRTYKSSIASQNALLISGGTISLKQSAIEKTGDTSDENSDFYGTNAAVLVYNDATLNLDGSEVTTGGSHANAVFAYGTGAINVSNTKITTYKNNSGGIMVTGGGTIKANNLLVETSGNSAAAIRSDRGGGTILADGGTYKTHGQGSPTIYSTADITVKNAILESTASEGIVIEGKNSVTLEDISLTDTNNTLNGNSETYKNIFIYQSMSGDASEGTGTFTAKNSSITTNQGDNFYITNTSAKISLNNTDFTNNDENGVFLRAEGAKWGTSGKNGGEVELNIEYQDIFGDIVLDQISSVGLQIGKYSYFWGAINESNSGTAKVSISSGSVFVLGGDTYLTSLENGDTSNSNIYANGHKLYVDGKEVAVNNNTPPERENLTLAEPLVAVDSSEETNLALVIAAIVAAGLALVAIIIVAATAIRKKSRQASAPKPVATPPEPNATEEPKVQTQPETKPDEPKSFPKDIDVNDISPTDKE